MPPPNPDGWKSAAKKVPKSAPVPNTSRRGWQPGAKAPKTKSQSTGRGKKLLLAGIAVGLLTAVIVAVVLWLKPAKFPHLILVAPDTETLSLPENAAGVKSATELEAWTSEAKNGAKLHAGRAETTEAEAWKAKLNSLPIQASGVVLYIAAHGAADDKGPYLWFPPKAGTPLSEKDKLPVREILSRLAEQPSGRAKLLVFDLAQTPPNWIHGGGGDFAKSLKAIEPEIEKIPGLSVMCSNDADQISWHAEDRGQTAFGFLFKEAVRGAGRNPFDAISAEDVHVRLQTEVQNWAVANRGANQTPILLPASSGAKLAKAMTLALVPDAGYTQPAAAPAPVAPPDPFLAEYRRAERLGAMGNSPDSLQPNTWRSYTATLQRWERLSRLNAVPSALPLSAKKLGDDLERSAQTNPAYEAVSLAAKPSAEEKPDPSWESLWKPLAPSTAAKEWELLSSKATASGESALRNRIHRFVLNQILTAGPTAENLARAEAVLTAVGEEGAMPVELHFVRMLAKHLDAKDRPTPEQLRKAIELRSLAEVAAWGDNETRPFAEQAFRFSRSRIDDADAKRQRGEDLLFHTAAASWKEAEGLFGEAETNYRLAIAQAKTIARSLALRDRIFARYPDYAHWLSSPRGLPASAAALQLDLEASARLANGIQKVLRDLPRSPTVAESDTAVAALQKLLPSPENEPFAKDEKAHRDYAASLGTQVQESNWHALDGVLAVPYLPAELRFEKLRTLRSITYELAAKSQQAGTSQAPVSNLQASHLQSAKFAAAYLDEASLATGSGDAVAARFLKLPTEATDARHKAELVSRPLRDVAPEYVEAARLGRLCDSASLPLGTPNPSEAERAYWRHEFLLGQANRSTLDGWGSLDPTETDPLKWHCQRCAALLLDGAKAELKILIPDGKKLDTAETERLETDWVRQAAIQPALLKAKSETERTITDERQLRYGFDLEKSGSRFGFPVVWYELPPKLASANPGVGRLLERRLFDRDKVATTAKFNIGERGQTEKGAEENLIAKVLYRGRWLQSKTKIALAGAPSLEITTAPYTGSAAMALQADPNAIQGAITILLDLTDSMNEKIPGGGGVTRIEEAIVGVEKLLETIPAGTQITIATFVGESAGKNFQLSARVLVKTYESNGTKPQRETAMKYVREVKAIEPSCTPLAGAIELVLDTKRGKEFWPTDFSGTKTLIVLTDGDDNWEKFGTGYTDSRGRKIGPGECVKEALKASILGQDDNEVAVYLAFFAMKKADVDTAEAQFKSLEKDAELTERNRLQIVRDVSDAKSFAKNLSGAVLPRIPYRNVVGSPKGTLVATRTEEPAYNPTPRLKPGTYALGGAKGLPSVQLEPGERVLLRAGIEKNQFKITRPTIAYDLAKRLDFPHIKTGLVALTMPSLKTRPGKLLDLKTVVTFEEDDPGNSPERLLAPPRDLAWFDVKYPDGAKPGGSTRVQIRNYVQPKPEADRLKADNVGLLAPAWEIDLLDWDRSDPDKFRSPQITGHWIVGLPKALDVRNLKPNELLAESEELPFKEFSYGDGRVPLQDFELKKTAEGYYLTLWMRYEPGKLVHLQTGWKPKTIAEKHSYFESAERYTAVFGPMSVEELEKPLRLELYSVDALRKRATDTRRAATLPGNPSARESDGKPLDFLKLPPSEK